MADENGSQNLSKNPDPQVKRVSGDDITPSQEQLRLQMEAPLPDRLPQSLIEWLERINRRYLALNQEKTNDTS
jgi:hypothetical protein